MTEQSILKKAGKALDWPDMFRRYADAVLTMEGVSFLYRGDFTDDEWRAIGEAVRPVYHPKAWEEQWGE